MPKICEFYGIVIYMYYNDHNPPHFHVQGCDCDAVCNIKTFMIEGEISKNTSGKVRKWANIHQLELLVIWEKTQKHLSLGTIK